MSADVIVDEWRPNYKRRCMACDQKPTVNGVQRAKDGKPERVVYRGDLCGACTWGSARMLNPENWNK